MRTTAESNGLCRACKCAGFDTTAVMVLLLTALQLVDPVAALTKRATWPGCSHSLAGNAVSSPGVQLLRGAPQE